MNQQNIKKNEKFLYRGVLQQPKRFRHTKRNINFTCDDSRKKQTSKSMFSKYLIYDSNIAYKS